MKTEILNAYFAGLIDGEGTIGVYTFKSGVTRPIIKVDMTCETTIKALHQYFGGYMGVKKVENLPNRKPQWRWEVTFSKAKEVARLLMPYLITKTANAELVLACTPKNKRGRPRKTTAS